MEKLKKWLADAYLLHFLTIIVIKCHNHKGSGKRENEHF